MESTATCICTCWSLTVKQLGSTKNAGSREQERQSRCGYTKEKTTENLLPSHDAVVSHFSDLLCLLGSCVL